MNAMSEHRNSGFWSRRYVKSLVIVFGTLLGGGWVVANFFGLYYAKLYLFDRPAMTINLHATQLATDDSSKQLVITLELENNGIRPYEIPLTGVAPITIVRISKDKQDGGSYEEGELSYQVVKSISLPSVYPEGKDGAPIVRNPRGLRLSPGQKGRYAVTTLLPGPGVYFVEFTGATPYWSSLEWVADKLAGRPGRTVYFSASAIAHVR